MIWPDVLQESQPKQKPTINLLFYLGKTIPLLQPQQLSLIILQGNTAQGGALFAVHLSGLIGRPVSIFTLGAGAHLGVYGVSAC